jgi:hypothetical protein
MSSPHTRVRHRASCTPGDRAGISAAEPTAMIEISWDRLAWLCSTAIMTAGGDEHTKPVGKQRETERPVTVQFRAVLGQYTACADA